jgi:predicted ester cyclase
MPLALLAMASVAAAPPLAADGTEDANKAVVREYYETALNRDELDRDLAHRFLADDVEALRPTEVAHRETNKRSVIPDLRYEIEEILANGDRVIVRGKEVGTHSGSSVDAPATGNRLDIPMAASYTVRDGKIRVRWALDDMLGLAKILGYSVKPPGN